MICSCMMASSLSLLNSARGRGVIGAVGAGVDLVADQDGVGRIVDPDHQRPGVGRADGALQQPRSVSREATTEVWLMSW